MKKVLVAIGGYDKRNDTLDAFEDTFVIDREIVKQTGKKSPRILFIPTASCDSQKYVTKFLKMYKEKLRCKTDVLLLYKEKPGYGKIKEKIMNSDAVYLGGGNTFRMMKYWRKLKVDKILKEAYRKGIVIAGLSAGCISMFKFGVSDSRRFSNPANKEYIRVTGLGLINAIGCPHYLSKIYDKGYRAKALKRVSARTPKMMAIAIQDGCALLVIDKKYKVISSIKGRNVYKCYNKKSRFYSDQIKIQNNLQSLAPLLKI